MEGLVSTRKETDRERRTDFLETAEGETCKDTERNWPSEAHSPTGDDRGKDLSGHGKKPTEQGTLTNWRQQREGLVRKRKTRASEVHSHSGDSRGRDLSGHKKKVTERGTLTSWRRQREGPVRTRKETDRARRTHFLETAEGEPCKDTERNWPSEAHSHSGDGRRRGLSGHGNKPTERSTLTTWRRQREGLVRTRKNRASEVHSLPGGSRERELSGHRNKPSEQGTLTNWRR
jgi:hypothetical protein